MGLIIKDLTKSFEEKSIFNGFSYAFSDTGIYCIVGESGVGKTTLLRLISGLDKDFGGEIFGGGVRNTSFAFQEYRLFPNLTALENTVIANGDMKNEELIVRAKALFARLGFSDSDLTLLPKELSGGMKQRVNLVRAFLKKSEILILDEPTKELDAAIISSLYELIKEEAKQRLVLIVTHREQDVQNLTPKIINL